MDVGGPRVPANVTSDIGAALFYSTGRRNIRIFGLPPEHLVYATALSFLFTVPTTLFVGMLPLWERVGEWRPIKEWLSLIAPALDDVSFESRGQTLPRFPIKRFLVAVAILLQLVLFANLLSAFSRRIRKHALLVWRCYDRARLLRYFAISGVVFVALWFVLFFDWNFLGLLASAPRVSGRFGFYVALALPFVTFVFGHFLTIVVLGLGRDVSRAITKGKFATKPHRVGR